MTTSDNGAEPKCAPGTAPDWTQLAADPVLLLAFGFGSGKSPVAPGTFGTVVGVVLFPVLALLPVPAYLALVLILSVLGIWVCQHASHKLGVHDHGGIVFDEMAGYWLAMTAFPVSWQWMLLGFVLFRLFDIVKPWPIRWLDRRVQGGFGIMVDDLLAGVFTWLVMFGIQRLLG
jgi:Phosphatidylglycerophosphatase A and related proteins